MRSRNPIRSGRLTLICLAFALFTLTATAGCGKRGDRKDAREHSPEGGTKELAEVGDRVQVHYRGTLDDGSVFDESPPDQPLEFVVGSGQMIAGFEKAVLGMRPGEEKRVTLPPEEAYGPRDEERVTCIPRSRLPEAYKPEEGMGIRLEDRDGRPLPGTIVRIGTDSVRVDLNHPLAGMSLTFDIKVLAVWGPGD